MTGWSEVDDHGQPDLRDEWRAVPDDPPLQPIEIEVPKEFVVLGQSVPR